ncbi:hypothetical protein Q8F55_009034 [Vanrija albida]|uniref:Uncharacterized protein n=1 Tax=Vanrija albida TaxID=181172 RepID=A0ABR3PSH4_9TREE
MASWPGRARHVAARDHNPTSTVVTSTGAHTHPSPAVHAAATTSSAPGLPSTTIVALGLCFVAAALFVVLLTILARVHQVRRMTRAAQATGEDIDFSRMWTQQGGWLGYLVTAGDALGPHGMWDGQGRAYRRVQIPRMWEADVESEPSDDDLDLEKDQPLAIVPAPTQAAPDDLGVSFLVRMPSPELLVDAEKRISHYDDDDEPELPYLMLGTTFVSPSTSLAAAGINPGALDDPAKRDVVELEYNPRRLPNAPPYGTGAEPYATGSMWADAFGMNVGTMRR